MGVPTFTRLVDGVDPMEVANVNPLYAAVEAQAMALALADYAHTRTLSGTLTLTDADLPIQFLECNGAVRQVNLPAEASTNHPFWIRNNTSGTAYNITVKNDGGDTIATIEKGQTKLFLSNGVEWDLLDSSVSLAGTETLTNKDISSSTNTYRAASQTVVGAAEIATPTEITTGTDDARVISPDGLAGSDYGKRIMEVVCLDTATALAVKDGVGDFQIVIPSEMNGWNLVGAHAAVFTVSSSGTPTIQIANVTDSVDMLSTRITIDASEYTSYTAATAPVIDTTKDDVATGDRLRIDCDVAGTGTKGLVAILVFQLP